MTSSIDLPDGDIPLTPEQRDELCRRLDAFDREREHAVTWAELKAELFGG